MLDGLTAPVRRAFLMAQLDGMKQADIARALGLSLTTVKRYLVQAGMHCFFAVQA
jgi:RNA polymerase sigma-70 factor (ECF subfamily)